MTTHYRLKTAFTKTLLFSGRVLVRKYFGHVPETPAKEKNNVPVRASKQKGIMAENCLDSPLFAKCG